MKWDATTWEVEGQNRGSRHGLWVREPQTRRLGLLKFPKIRFASGQEFETGEVGAEVLAAKVGRFLGIPVPEVETAVFEDRLGSLSWSFLDEGYTLREGVDLLSAAKGDVRPSVGVVLNVLSKHLGSNEAIRQLTNLLVFDILIANGDRHQGNWGVLVPSYEGHPNKIAPFYDNGAGFGSSLEPQKVAAYVVSETDRDRFDRGFRYAMSVRGDKRARIQELLHTLMEWGSHLDNFAARLKTMTDTQIEALIESIEPNILSHSRRKLARELLVRRRNIVLEEVAKGA